jgi:hypothetical protein
MPNPTFVDVDEPEHSHGNTIGGLGCLISISSGVKASNGLNFA